MYKSKKRNILKGSSRNKNSKRKTKRLYLLRRKYKYYKGGATFTTPTVGPNVTLPIVVDKNSIAYTCVPIPKS
jgi:hypothetical protein